MSHSSIARVPTLKGDAYRQQLAKHWSHKLDVREDAGASIIIFPRDSRGADWPGPAQVTLKAESEVLVCTIEASAAEQRDQLKEVVAVHLDRFAFREAPLAFDWS